MELSKAFEVFDRILGIGLEGSIHAHRFGSDEIDFTVTLSLADRTPEQLTTLAAISEQYNLELDVDDHRLASLK
jgi:hypothetical protein